MAVLQDRIAVITGSTRGFGLAVAEAFAREGATVVISSRSAESVKQAIERLCAGGVRASGQVCDVADPAQVERLAAHAVERWGRFDIWVNNAGLSAPYGPTVHVPPEAFVRVLQTNILGSYYGSTAAMRHFLPRRSGKLINILGRGDTGPQPMQNAYTSTKAWLRTFTLALAREYKDSGVGVYALNPGMLRTDFLMRVHAVAGYEKLLSPLATVIRMWAFPPEQPARKAVWLASAATDGRTGLLVREMNAARLLGGALAEGWRRLMGRPADPSLLPVVISVPPAISLSEDRS